MATSAQFPRLPLASTDTDTPIAVAYPHGLWKREQFSAVSTFDGTMARWKGGRQRQRGLRQNRTRGERFPPIIFQLLLRLPQDARLIGDENRATGPGICFESGESTPGRGRSRTHLDFAERKARLQFVEPIPKLAG